MHCDDRLIHSQRHARRLLEDEKDLGLRSRSCSAARIVWLPPVIAAGEVHEGLMIHRALQLAPR